MLQLKELSKSFGSQVAVEGVSFDLQEGESILINGPTGCGKTTLLKLIAGLEVPDQGEIFNRGELISKPGWASEPSSRSIGFVFQDPALWPHMTVKENLMFGLDQMPKIEARKLLDQVVKDLFIDQIQDRYPHEISGGEARLVALARSFAPAPRLLLMDEPLVNLNPELKENVWQYISTYLHSPKTSVIYVTHNRDEATSFPGGILSMKSGTILREKDNH